METKTPTTKTFEDVKAKRDKQKPPHLTVTGKVLVYTDDTKAYLKDAEPQGFNPTDLILDVIVEKGSGPMKGVYKEFEPYVISSNQVPTYLTVTLRYEEAMEHVKIDG
jgi:hypothetical protein